MMKISKLSLAAAVSVALFSSAAMADSWDITQDVNIVSPATITQSGANSGSTQALNAINAGGTTIIDGSSQAVTMDGTSSLTIDQAGTTETSTQAANYTVASDMAGSFTQGLPGTGAVTLNQTATGATNTQGMNIVESGTIVGTLTQSSLSETVAMNQGVGAANTGANATQVGNALITSGTANNVDQDLGAGGTLTMQQETTGANATQVGNLIDASDANAVITAATQNITTTGGVGSFTLSQDGTSSALQAGNAVINDSGNTGSHVVDQSVDIETLAQVQSDTTSSWQADNYVGPVLP